jgi:hypothetical protein
MTARLVGDAKTRFGGGSLDEYLSARGADAADEAVDMLIELLVAVPLVADSRDRVVAICEKNDDRSGGIADAIHALATLPEFQLC